MSNRPSLAQQEGLVEFLEQNPGIAKGLLRTTQAKLETKRKWAALANSLNALGGVNKDGQGWAKYWAEKKCALKKHCAQLSSSMTRTGDGPALNIPQLSELDNRMVAVMGGPQFACRDLRLSVNPFPDAPRQLSPPIIIPESVLPVEDQTYELQTSPVLDILPHDEAAATPTIPSGTPPPLPQSSATRRRRRSSISRTLYSDMERFTRIEERRVETENTTAQAFATTAQAFATTAQAVLQLTEERHNIANALHLMANAMIEIARKLPDPQ